MEIRSYTELGRSKSWRRKNNRRLRSCIREGKPRIVRQGKTTRLC